ncbi:MAG TPA: 4Fe-4S binding protein [Anaerolineaceae bacterium]|nr:4Fe-4S binding protein [Anaerolineaceae bacterium]HOD06018.1 4Fe-4S binding protein [Anaerolineaceae bacterium]
MPHVITSLCLRDGGCATVCPVECIVPGKPVDKWPLYYIDADTCIDCGACVSECPWAAIFPVEELPAPYVAKGGEYLSEPVGTAGYETVYDGKNHDGDAVHLTATRILAAGEKVDLTGFADVNAAFFKEGPGYSAKD